MDSFNSNLDFTCLLAQAKKLIKTTLYCYKFYLQVCLVLDYLFDVPSKIIHAPAIDTKGELRHSLVNHVDALRNHFQKFGSPIMMGGDVDSSSKGK